LTSDVGFWLQQVFLDLGLAQMFIGVFSGDAAAGRAFYKAQLEQKRLVNIFYGGFVFGSGGGQGLQADRAAFEFFYENVQYSPVVIIKSQLVYFHQVQGFFGEIQIYPAAFMNLGEITATFQEMIGDSGGVPASFGDLFGRVAGNFHPQNAGRAGNYFFHLFVGVKFQTEGATGKSRSKRGREHSPSGGGGDKSKRRELQLDASRRRTLADDDVQRP